MAKHLDTKDFEITVDFEIEKDKYSILFNPTDHKAPESLETYLIEISKQDIDKFLKLFNND